MGNGITKILFAAALLALAALPRSAQETEIAAEAAADTTVWKYFAAALAVGISCVAGGIAVGQIGSAAMGAMSENPELSGKALPYAGLAEGICLWGFLVALLIMIF
ncbi:MAG: ATP synthase subunit C [Treponema sp.]|nr:ATP synthase subunit C [Treponema sp.]